MPGQLPSDSISTMSAFDHLQVQTIPSRGQQPPLYLGSRGCVPPPSVLSQTEKLNGNSSTWPSVRKYAPNRQIAPTKQGSANNFGIQPQDTIRNSEAKFTIHYRLPSAHAINRQASPPVPEQGLFILPLYGFCWNDCHRGYTTLPASALGLATHSRPSSLR